MINHPVTLLLSWSRVKSRYFCPRWALVCAAGVGTSSGRVISVHRCSPRTLGPSNLSRETPNKTSRADVAGGKKAPGWRKSVINSGPTTVCILISICQVCVTSESTRGRTLLSFSSMMLHREFCWRKLTQRASCDISSKIHIIQQNLSDWPVAPSWRLERLALLRTFRWAPGQ